MPLQMYSETTSKGAPRIKNILAVAAGKGGVGKSTIAVNLALALKKLGYAVGLMDTDVYGPSVRRMLPEDRLPAQRGQKIIPALCRGIHVISMAYFRKEGEAAVIRAPIANGIVVQFLQQVEWGELDYLILDFPPGTGDVQLTLAQQANLTGAIIVTTPQEVALMDVRKAMHMFAQVKVPIIGVVENMSYYQPDGAQEKIYLFGQGGGQKLAREQGVPLLGQIAVDPLICQSGDMGKSLFDSPSSSADSFLSLAKETIDQTEALKQATMKGLAHFELNWKEMAVK